MRYASKPVVIGDSVPLPACPSPVEQLLHSALAHHNLGSFEETILFLDAAKREFQDIKSAAKDGTQDTVIELPINFEMYVLLSKGNLYRSCGEDERAMLCYIEGWDISKEHQDKGADWEVIFINSIGVLAYYLVRYDIALMCFDRVVRYREQEYGSDSSDTATALNNEGCSLFGMNERGEARLRFERSWLVGKCERCTHWTSLYLKHLPSLRSNVYQARRHLVIVPHAPSSCGRTWSRQDAQAQLEQRVEHKEKR